MEHWVEEMEGWDDRPFSGGYAGLRDLAADDFSGAVSTDGTWLFMVKGRVVAVVERRQTNGDTVTDADVERFEDTQGGTAYAAPHPSIPLLVAMKTREGETRGKYYTEKTPVDEVAATLGEGGFTGYVELSENVLSGDYYTVYQAGHATDLAFVGNARRLLTGDDAHERMADEVGIYEVVAVDLDVVDVPGADSDASGDAVGAGGAGTGATGAGAASSETGVAGASGATDDAAATGAATDDTAAAGDTDGTGVGPSTDETAEPDAAGGAGAADAERGTAGAASAEQGEATPPAEEPSTAEPGDESVADWSEAKAGVAGVSAGRGEETASVTERIATRAVPSVDPDRSGTGADEETEPGGGVEDGGEGDPHGATASDRVAAADESTDASDADDPDDANADPPALDVLREEVRETREQLAVTKRERDDLAARVEELESQLEDRDGAPVAASGGASLDAAEAYAGTNLFVRYGSKGELTLDDAHSGAGNAEGLRANLRLEHHTTFEEAGATVDGRPFREWLEATQRFRFANWLVTTLLFEIRDTGAVEGMRELYDALPALDRVEFDGSVTIADDEDDDGVSFGVVGRDRMGDPLIVADLETTRDPVGEAAMADLVTDASATAGSHDTLTGAFYVTAAFYDPAALETAREATSGSLLSRDRRRSFVKLSRSAGYHLALVESRNASFHLTVPDL